MSRPAVSILVPTFNCAEYLPQLCESIQGQTFRDFEAVLWDDGSTDRTSEVIEPFLHDVRFRYQRAQRNQGLGKSWRALLTAAQGKFWCCPGADDVLLPDFLERRVAGLESAANAVLVHGPPIYIDSTGREMAPVWKQVNPPRIQPGEDALRALLQHNYINQPSTLVCTETTAQILSHWNDEWRYAPDWHLWIVHAATGKEFVYDPVPAHRYRIHAKSLTGSVEHDALRRVESRLVPLVAARRAAEVSKSGARIWMERRRALYSLWLRRAWMLRTWPNLAVSLQIGAHAFKTTPASPHVSLPSELLAHALDVLWFGIREGLARRRQSFPVSGLAQMDHELFRPQ